MLKMVWALGLAFVLVGCAGDESEGGEGPSEPVAVGVGEAAGEGDEGAPHQSEVREAVSKESGRVPTFPVRESACTDRDCAPATEK